MALGCDVGQGYHFARPLTDDRLRDCAGYGRYRAPPIIKARPSASVVPPPSPPLRLSDASKTLNLLPHR